MINNYNLNKSMGYTDLTILRESLANGNTFKVYPKYNDITETLKEMTDEEILTNYYIGDLLEFEND
jgi:hypothetical protein